MGNEIEILPPEIDIRSMTWQVATIDPDFLVFAWAKAKASWLADKFRGSKSMHTIAAYERDWSEFFSFFGNGDPHAVQGHDAQFWQEHLEAKGLTETTINRKLSSLSSFYSYVLTDFIIRDDRGIERTLFCDPDGNPRFNPFKRPKRYTVSSYGKSNPLGINTIRSAMEKIDKQTAIGARDYALIITYILTGRRSVEIADLRWKDIQPERASNIPGLFKYSYRGKGNKQRDKTLAPAAYNSIIHFLKITERLETVQPDDFIFRPIYPTMGRPADAPAVDANHPIHGSQINRIVKRRFVAVGVKPEDVHTHTLRHTFAALLYKDGEGDILKISNLLDHENINTTKIYLDTMHRPIDTSWIEIQQDLGL